MIFFVARSMGITYPCVGELGGTALGHCGNMDWAAIKTATQKKASLSALLLKMSKGTVATNTGYESSPKGVSADEFTMTYVIETMAKQSLMKIRYMPKEFRRR